MENTQMYIDLHVHTTASDGSLSPSQVVHYAKEKGLKAIAVTDHDTIDGTEEALKEGKAAGIEVIPGVEISVDHSPGSMDMLGYFINTKDTALKENLSLLQSSRADRNPKIIEKLNELGLTITYDEVVEASGGGQVGRPHIAQVLKQKGYIQSKQEAFDKYLASGCPAYIEKFRLTPEKAIAMIVNAGGVAVLAHPFTLKGMSLDELETLLKTLAAQGLQGLEVYSSEHNRQQISKYHTLAEKCNLAITGGSDFHGKNTEGVDLGTGKGNMKIPYSQLEKLKNLWKEKHKKE
jgi:hypothetical protein